MLTHNIAKGGIRRKKKDGTKFVYSVSAKNPEVALPDESVSFCGRIVKPVSFSRRENKNHFRTGAGHPGIRCPRG